MILLFSSDLFAQKFGNFDESLYDVTEDLTSNLLDIASKNNRIDPENTKADTASINFQSDNISTKEETTEENSVNTEKNSITEEQNTFLSRPNPCNCEHGGECVPETKSCYCSTGFTGIHCEKRRDKALVLGGLRDVAIRLDSELVGGSKPDRCSPPSFPRPVMAATGQTAGDIVTVCGGATQIS